MISWLKRLLQSFRSKSPIQGRVVSILLVFLAVLIIITIFFVAKFDSGPDDQTASNLLLLLGLSLIAVVLHWLFHIQAAEKSVGESERRFKLVSYATNDAVWELDISNNKVWWNQNLYRLFGYRSEQVTLDRSWWESQLHPEDREKVVKLIEQAIEQGEVFWSKEYRFLRADGSYAHVFDRSYIERDDNGKAVRMLGAMMDISQWRDAEDALSEERNLLRTLIDMLPDRIYVKDSLGRKTISNNADWTAAGGKSVDDVLGKTDFDAYPRELAEIFWSDDRQVLDKGLSVFNREEPGFDQNGDPVWILTTKVPLLNKDRKVVGIVGSGREITTRKRMEEALQDANRKQTEWISELEHQTKEIALLNTMNDSLQSCQSIDEAYEVIGNIIQQLFPEESGELFMIGEENKLGRVASWGDRFLHACSMFDRSNCLAFDQKKPFGFQYSSVMMDPANPTTRNYCGCLDPDVSDAYVCTPVIAQGEIMGVLSLHHPVSQSKTFETEENTFRSGETRKQLMLTVTDSMALSLANIKLRESLRQQSIRDPLTGLFNRRYLEESLDREISRCSRADRPLGVIMLDIDHFKMFNDRFGHEAGDILLRQLGRFLHSKIRAEDIACRYGGEEFILIMPEAPLEVVHKRAESLRRAVKELNIPFEGQNLPSISLSGGIALFPDHGRSSEELIHLADMALYQGKRNGRDRVVVYQSQSGKKEKIKRS